MFKFFKKNNHSKTESNPNFTNQTGFQGVPSKRFTTDEILWIDYCDRSGYARDLSVTYTSSEYFAAVADAVETLRKSSSTAEALALEGILNFSNVGGEEMNNGIIKAEERYFEVVRSC